MRQPTSLEWWQRLVFTLLVFQCVKQIFAWVTKRAAKTLRRVLLKVCRVVINVS